MDTVLGVSITPDAMRTLLVGGDEAGGVTIDQDGREKFEKSEKFDSTDPIDQAVTRIAASRARAQAGGNRLVSMGIAVDDRVQSGALRDLLERRQINGAVLVSPLLAASALARSMGRASGYSQVALLFLDAHSATLAAVDTANGSIGEVHRVALPARWEEVVSRCAALAGQAGALVSKPDAMFVVGSATDVAALRPALTAASPIPVSTAAEPDTALAHGAALAATAPLLNSSTAALAWARDPGTGVISSDLAAYLRGASGAAKDYDATVETNARAYSAVDDDPGTPVGGVDSEGSARQDWHTSRVAGMSFDLAMGQPMETTAAPRRFLLAGSAMALFFTGSIAVLVAAIALIISPKITHRPAPPKPAPANAEVAPPAPSPSAPSAPGGPPAAPPEANTQVPAVEAPAPQGVPNMPVTAPERIPAPAAPAPVGPPPPGPPPPGFPEMPVVVPFPVPVPVPPWLGGDHKGDKGGWPGLDPDHDDGPKLPFPKFPELPKLPKLPGI